MIENMVARDGIGQHYANLSIPFVRAYLNPALELSRVLQTVTL